MRPALTFTDAPARTLLAVYLGDHLAGAVAGRAMARRCRGNNRDNEIGRALGELIPEIEQDRATLEGLMATLGIDRPRLKLAAGVAAERVGRLKLNGQLTGYSALSRVIELEALGAGIAAKESLWRSLDAAADGGEFHGLDLPVLIERAGAQRDRVEALRLRAARAAFDPESGGFPPPTA